MSLGFLLQYFRERRENGNHETGKISKRHEHSPKIIEKQLCEGRGEVLALFGSQVRINGIAETHHLSLNIF